MPKYFDIRSPQPNKPVSKPKSKNNLGLFFLVLIIIILAFFSARFLPKNISQSPDHRQTNDTNTDNFELFNPQGESNLTQTSSLGIRIINASGMPDATSKIKDLLIMNNFTIEQTSSVEEKYDQTTIYYKPGQVENAQMLEIILKNVYQPKLEESQTLGSTFDLMLIIGQK